MKCCLHCRRELPVTEFYRQAGDRLQANCKRCHNALCAARRRERPAYRAKQYAAKKAWNARNPARTMLHVRRCTGRLLWDPEREALRVPRLMLECQEALWALLAAIQQQRTKNEAPRTL